MKIAVASILQESNTFSPVFTRFEDFSPVFGADVLARHAGKLTELGGFLDVLARKRHDAVPICAAWAITANRLLKPDFDRLLAAFERHLAAAGDVDGLLLAMHGAQTAIGEDDVEGHILSLARRLLGPDKPIVLTLDLHANITHRMLSLASAILGYRTYPHIDMFETGQRAARLLLRILAGKLQPTMAMVKLPLILPAETSQTNRGPMRKIWKAALAFEQNRDTEAVSIFPTQPWLDIDEMGSAVVVVTNANRQLAQNRARRLARLLWDARRAFDVHLTPPADAIAQALQLSGGPVVLAESADSTGSGSPGDSTGVLKHLLRAPLTAPAAIFLVDPRAVRKAIQAGIGATVTMNVGACFDKLHSKPVRITAYVKLISDGRWVARARGYNTGITTSMGRSVVLECGHVLLLIAERSAMTVDPELFRSHGIDPAWCKIVVVKSPNGFRAAYEPIARKIFLVDTPGASTANLATLPWKRIQRPIYPLDPDTPPPAHLFS
jgi:microcystin degradation protein MlrC